MDDLIAVELAGTDAQHYFVTWGRLFEPPTETEGIIEAVKAHAPKWHVDRAETMTGRVCGSLREAAGAPYFFEALFDFSQRQIPFGAGYETWRAEKRKAVCAGHDISYVGAVSGTKGHK